MLHPPRLIELIPALLPRGSGHNFVLYGDSCSGVPDAPHERTFAAVNGVVRRLEPPPDFIVFPGDEISGLTNDPAELQAQWRYWLDHEMAWLDRTQTPLWHSTGNHTTYDATSERVFAAMLPHLPRNGPPGQEGLSYWVRRGDLLLVFVHTLWTGLGGEGHVETDWLEATLRAHGDARHRIVVGHHPVHPINGFSGPYQREVGPEHAGRFWDVLVAADVLAYVCSHILAYDVQVHRGVLQLCTAGAGTAHRMPEGIEYLHCVQAALDADGLRCHVLDTDGQVRERLCWPPVLPPLPAWRTLVTGSQDAPWVCESSDDRLIALRFQGRAPAAGTAAIQTLFCTARQSGMPVLWIGLRGPDQVLTVVLSPQPGRSPHLWLGIGSMPGNVFDIQLLIHTGMGPGGIMVRMAEHEPWSSLKAASAWGAELLAWPERWTVGQGMDGDTPFLGEALAVTFTTHG